MANLFAKNEWKRIFIDFKTILIITVPERFRNNKKIQLFSKKIKSFLKNSSQKLDLILTIFSN